MRYFRTSVLDDDITRVFLRIHSYDLLLLMERNPRIMNVSASIKKFSDVRDTHSLLWRTKRSLIQAISNRSSGNLSTRTF